MIRARQRQMRVHMSQVALLRGCQQTWADRSARNRQTHARRFFNGELCQQPRNGLGRAIISLRETCRCHLRRRNSQCNRTVIRFKLELPNWEGTCSCSATGNTTAANVGLLRLETGDGWRVVSTRAFSDATTALCNWSIRMYPCLCRVWIFPMNAIGSSVCRNDGQEGM